MKRIGKYNNRKTEVCGITFDSKKEAECYLVFREMEKKGVISDLKMQVGFELLPAVYGTRTKVKHLKSGDREMQERYLRQRPTYYYADFTYTENATGNYVVVDVKSPATRKKDAYVLKKKMMLALKGIEITET